MLVKSESNKYYDQIDKAIKSYEQFRSCHSMGLDKICDKIDWCWKWRKISETQMHNLVDRIVYLMDNNLV